METHLLFSWVHLSDIHLGHGDDSHALDQLLILDALQKDIQDFQIYDIKRLDAICLTGDLAFSGNVRKTTEYQSLGKWLRDLMRNVSVDKDRVFLVPGNHDIQRDVTKVDKNVARLLESLRTGREKIDNVLSDPNDKKLLTSRLKNYLEFAKEFDPSSEGKLFWMRQLISTGAKIRIVGFNTALLSADDKDEKQLELGNRQIYEAFTSIPVEPDEIVIALSHHPFDWLRDERNVSEWTSKYAHIHLSGHIHEPYNERLRSGSGTDLIRIVAGAVHGEPSATRRFGYSIGSLWRSGNDKVLLRIWPRVWSQRNCAFRADLDNVPDRKTFAEHEVEVQLPPFSQQVFAFDESPPFKKEDFVYDLPPNPSLASTLVPVPCDIEQIPSNNAFDSIVAEITTHYERRQQQEYTEHADAWTEACTHVTNLLGKEYINLDVARETAISRYLEKSKQRKSPLLQAQVWFLITGDTGAGKTTLVENLARAFNATLVDLRDFSPSYSIDALIKNAEHADALSIEDSQLSRKPRILILDALDKMVPGATYQVTIENLRAIKACATSYHIVIITSRTAFFRTHREEQLPHSKHVKLLPLAEEEALRRSEMSGVHHILDAAIKKSLSIRDMAGKPLLLNILINLIGKGYDISNIDDQEDLFARVVDEWLSRDTTDAITPSDIRLKCMQCLALHSLAIGGGPFSYSTIDSIVNQMLTPSTSEQVERFNTDLRVCGFLKRLDKDLFEFQHAAFYEYCIARSVLEDLRQGDFVAVGSHPFTNEIIDFITRRAERLGRVDDLAASINNAWNSNLSSTARVNLMKVFTAVKGNCDALSLNNLTIEGQNLAGIIYLNKSNSIIHNVTFRECDFTGANLGRIIGEHWIFERCLIGECHFKFARFNSAEVNDTHWFFEDDNLVHFSLCSWVGCSLEAGKQSSITIQGGTIQACMLTSIVEEHMPISSNQISVTVRLATLEKISFGQRLSNWRIEHCSIDSLSLFGLAIILPEFRPRLSAEILRGVNEHLSRPESARPIINPHVGNPTGGEQRTIYNSLSKSQRRKIKQKILNSLDPDKK